MLLLDFLKNFVIGGFIEGLITMFAEYMDPRYSAIFWAFPLTLIASIILLANANVDYKKIVKLSRSAFYSTVKLTIFFVIFLTAIHTQQLKDKKDKIPISYALGCVGYVVLAVLFLYI